MQTRVLGRSIRHVAPRLQKQAARSFLSTSEPGILKAFKDQIITASKMPRTPLTEPLRGYENIGSESAPTTTGPAQISKLPNGVQVVTVDRPTPTTNIAVLVQAGSRYENPDERGFTHLMEQLAFKTNQKRTGFSLVREMSKLGGNVTAQAGREDIFYSGEVLRENAGFLVETFRDILFNHALHPNELQEQIKIYEETLEDARKHARHDLMEEVHHAAYSQNSLGNPLYPSSVSLKGATREALWKYYQTFWVPERVIVAGVGIDHQRLVNLLTNTFPESPSGRTAPEKAPAQYTGGDLRFDTRDNPANNGLAEFVLAFETAGWTHKDLVPMCVLQMMMGGGGSFSSGGPGKGMHSRMYNNVLNKYHFAQSASAFSSIFSDSALFGVHGIADAADAGSLANVLADQLTNMTGPVSAEELVRAKNQLKSSVFMHLESKLLSVEDLARQLSSANKVETAEDMASQIDAVTDRDIQRVASNLLKTPLTVAAHGDLSQLPRYDALARRF